MAQPTPYDRATNFTNQQALAPNDPVSGSLLDQEFNRVKQTLDEMSASLTQIQRGDGGVANASVGLDQLTNEVLGSFNVPLTWTAGTVYAVNDLVVYGTAIYRCVTAHTASSSFLTDLSNLRWTLVVDADTSVSEESRFATAAIAEAFVPSGESPSIIYLDGGAGLGDDGAGDYVKIVGTPASYDPYLRIAGGTGAYYVRAEVEVPRGARQWKAQWWGLQDSNSVDQTLLVQKIFDTIKNDNEGRAIEILFPNGDVCLNGGVSDTPINIDGCDGLTITMARECRLIKTQTQRILIQSGLGGSANNVTIRGGQLIGGSIDDGDNDWPLIFLKNSSYVTYEDIYAEDCNTALRVGHSSTSCSNVRVRNCTLSNVEEHGIEMFNVNHAWVTNNRIAGGARSTGNNSRPIRILQSANVWVDRNDISNSGTGVALDTDSGNQQTNIYITNNVITGSNSADLAAIWSYFGLKDCMISGNIIRDMQGCKNGIFIGQIADADRSENLTVCNNRIIANNDEVRLIRISELDGGVFSGNFLKHTSQAFASSQYALYFNKCGGLIVCDNNTIHMDATGTNPRGIYDNAGLSSLNLVAKNNTFLFDTTASNQTAQAGSSGTLSLGGDVGDTNLYLTI